MLLLQCYLWEETAKAVAEFEKSGGLQYTNALAPTNFSSYEPCRMWIVTFDRSVGIVLTSSSHKAAWLTASRYGGLVALPMWLDRWLTCVVAMVSGDWV